MSLPPRNSDVDRKIAASSSDRKQISFAIVPMTCSLRASFCSTSASRFGASTVEVGGTPADKLDGGAAAGFLLSEVVAPFWAESEEIAWPGARDSEPPIVAFAPST